MNSRALLKLELRLLVVQHFARHGRTQYGRDQRGCMYLHLRQAAGSDHLMHHSREVRVNSAWHIATSLPVGYKHPSPSRVPPPFPVTLLTTMLSSLGFDPKGSRNARNNSKVCASDASPLRIRLSL